MENAEKTAPPAMKARQRGVYNLVVVVRLSGVLHTRREVDTELSAAVNVEP
jgi:hypothetical protein